MKKHLLLTGVTFLSVIHQLVAFAGNSIASPNIKAARYVANTKKDIVSRMTLVQYTTFFFPPTGLLIYQTDSMPGLYNYDAGKALSFFTFPFANKTLSNLKVPTALNVNLLPGITGVRNLGSLAKGWRNLYLNGAMYIAGNRFLSIKGEANTFIGTQAGNSTTTGDYNTATGYLALYNNNIGNWNTANGLQALYNNTEGFENTASGAYALGLNTEGSLNTATGISALNNNETGASNTANGGASLLSNTTGDFNTAVGAFSLYFNTATLENTAIGFSAGDFTTNPSQGTFLGARTSAADDLTNMTAIGYGTQATASNQVRIGNISVRSIGGKVGWTTFSDGRYNKNVKEEVPGLEFINKLRPVTFNLDMKGMDPANKKDMPQPRTITAPSPVAPPVANLPALKAYPNNAPMERKVKQGPAAEEMKAKAEKGKIKYSGFVAQEVEKAAKDIKYDFSGVDAPGNSKDFYGLRYGDFVVPLVKAVQELSEENKQLKEENKEIKERLQKLETIIGNNNNSNINNTNTSLNLSAAYLEQSTPNPSRGTTVIPYHIPLNAGNATVVITDIKGTIIKSISLKSKGSGQLTINNGTLAAGYYSYTLYVDGKETDSKHMIITK